LADATILAGLDVSIKRSAEGDQPGDGLVQVFYDEVEVNRRPVALIPPNRLLGSQVCESRTVGKQKYRQIRACEVPLMVNHTAINEPTAAL